MFHNPLTVLNYYGNISFEALEVRAAAMLYKKRLRFHEDMNCRFNPYPTAFPYGNGMVLHFYQQQESSTTKTVHKVINKRLKTYV